jgi:hypothetical protein
VIGVDGSRPEQVVLQRFRGSVGVSDPWKAPRTSGLSPASPFRVLHSLKRRSQSSGSSPWRGTSLRQDLTRPLARGGLLYGSCVDGPGGGVPMAPFTEQSAVGHHPHCIQFVSGHGRGGRRQIGVAIPKPLRQSSRTGPGAAPLQVGPA